MNLKSLSDQDILSRTQNLVQQERTHLTLILHHLREVERRKLFSPRFSSLFDYAVKELRYSEGQAGRRIQAMRLLKELPEIEQKIESGALNLTTISKAQSFFREAKKTARPETLLKMEDKAQILTQLENKSVRETDRLLISLNSEAAIPKEKHRIVSATQLEVRLILDNELSLQLEKIKSLLGSQSGHISMAELIKEMAQIAEEALMIKKFGKRVVAPDRHSKASEKRGATPSLEFSPAPEAVRGLSLEKPPTPKTKNTKGSTRYISKALKYKIWQRDRGECVLCGGQHNLQVDHVKPFGLGGESNFENLRLLCFHCNQRRSIKTFGLRG